MKIKPTLLIIATIIALFTSKSKASDQPIQPHIYKSEVTYFSFTRRYIFDCYATNLDYGTLWVFETNSDLLTTNWSRFTSTYYTGFGTNFTVPYISPGYNTAWTPQVFMRMTQVGTNFTFFSSFEHLEMIGYYAESERAARELNRSIPVERTPAITRNWSTFERPLPPSIEEIMPPVITNRFFH